MKRPDSIMIMHHRDFVPVEGYFEEQFFRLKHDLCHIPKIHSDNHKIRAAETSEIPSLVQMINASYEDLAVTQEQLWSMTRTPVYEPGLWLVAENRDGETVGSILCDLDRENREGILEWVQVLPEYRGQGLGKLLVTQALTRMLGEVNFATVSGNCSNRTNPERLYRSCGFTGNDIWHILHRV